jgi:predicted nucleic acid-binding protein
MDLVAACRGRRVYLDTNVFIYAVEGLEAFAPMLAALFARMEAGEIRASTSELALAEALAKPIEAGREDVVRVYEAMLTPSGWLSVLPVDRAVLIEAARLRAGLKLRLPDAIHIATAVRAGCDLVLSNDKRMKVPAGMKLLALG